MNANGMISQHDADQLVQVAVKMVTEKKDAEIKRLREALKEARDLVHEVKDVRIPEGLGREEGDLVFGLVDIYGMEDSIKRWDSALSAPQAEGEKR